MNNDFWLENPSILLEKNKIFEIWPKEHYNMAEKLNAITRSIIVLTTLGYLSTKSLMYVTHKRQRGLFSMELPIMI